MQTVLRLRAFDRLPPGWSRIPLPVLEQLVLDGKKRRVFTSFPEDHEPITEEFMDQLLVILAQKFGKVLYRAGDGVFKPAGVAGRVVDWTTVKTKIQSLS